MRQVSDAPGARPYDRRKHGGDIEDPEAVSEFLAMGGYGGFVWPAFGLTALVLVWLLAASLRRLRANERLLAQMEAGGRRGRRAPPNAAGKAGEAAP